MNKRPQVVVIGGGFAGLKAVEHLAKTPVDITLVDRHNYHLFQPLLYQVATAALSPADIAYPIRRIFRHQMNTAVVLADLEFIDLEHNEIGGERAKRKFDYLIVAVGSTHSYFGHPEWNKFAPGLKTVDDATEIRRRVLLAFEGAEYEADEESRRAKLTFVVVGGGPTGVELAGALREIAANNLPKDFRSIDTKTSRIILIQGGDRLLPAFPEKLSDRAKTDLEKMGVEIRLNSRVTKVDETGVCIGDERVEAANVFWAAGVQAPPILKTMNVPMDQSGRVIVENDLSVPGHRNVFVVGDAADAKDAKTGKSVPGLAPAAMQMGTFVAGIIRDEVNAGGKVVDRPAFKYHDKGTLATIGTHRAVADIAGFKFGGYFAWLLWSGVHVTFLVSFRNKLWVMLSWAWQFLTNGREARLITGEARLQVKTIRTSDELEAVDAKT